jgi:hypothetical protein
MPMDAVWANGIGMLLYPLTWWQYHHSKSKTVFLLANFLACVVNAASFWLTDQATAAAVAMAAGTTSLLQIRRTHIIQNLCVAAGSVGVVACMAPPTGMFPWLALMSYAWNRTAECFRESTMRVLFLISPVLWMLIAWNGRNYTLIPADAFAFALSLHWVIRRITVLESALSGGRGG